MSLTDVSERTNVDYSIPDHVDDLLSKWRTRQDEELDWREYPKCTSRLPCYGRHTVHVDADSCENRENHDKIWGAKKNGETSEFEGSCQVLGCPREFSWWARQHLHHMERFFIAGPVVFESFVPLKEMWDGGMSTVRKTTGDRARAADDPGRVTLDGTEGAYVLSRECMAPKRDGYNSPPPHESVRLSPDEAFKKVKGLVLPSKLNIGDVRSQPIIYAGGWKREDVDSPYVYVRNGPGKSMVDRAIERVGGPFQFDNMSPKERARTGYKVERLSKFLHHQATNIEAAHEHYEKISDLDTAIRITVMKQEAAIEEAVTEWTAGGWGD